MKLQAAIEYFEKLKSETTEKAEFKIYDKFILLLSRLNARDFSENEIQALEKELDLLVLEPDSGNRKKYFKKALSEFHKFLKQDFSLTPKGYYTALGVGLGSSFGVVLGVLIGERLEKSLGISLGISIGLFIGLLIGRVMDSQAKAAGKML